MAVSSDSVVESAARWLNEGQAVACATVIRTWRSSPRPVGSQMVIAEDGRFAGSVSGGCVEAAVIHAAAEVLASSTPQSLSFGVTREEAWSVGLPCGGRIEVFVTPLKQGVAERCERARLARESLVLALNLSTGETDIWEGQAIEGVASCHLEATRAGGEARLVESESDRWFLAMMSAPLRILVVGAAHLSQALAELAHCSGYAVTVIDPRTAFATEARFPTAELSRHWPDEALSELKPDRNSAVVVLSHDEKLDDPALIAALSSPCFYIGALGSQKTQAARRRRLSEAGFGEADLRRIHGPVGLAIGAKTPQEIAIAILAEIVQARRIVLPPENVPPRE